MDKKLNILIKFLLIIFIVELVLGFNGRFIVINNIQIRAILFLLVTIGIYISMIMAIKSKNIRIKKRNFKYFINNYFSQFDKVLAVFLCLNMIWVFIVPILTGTSVKLSIKEILCANIFLIYFPTVILIKLDLVNWNTYKSVIKISIFTLAVIHIIFYIGEKIVGDATFVLNIFKAIEKFTGGHTIRPIVMMPDSYIRIIYPASILLIVIFYFIINSDLTIKNAIFMLAGIGALFATVTKSLVLGVIGGLIFYYSIVIYRNVINKEKININKQYKFLSLLLVSSIVCNYTLFDNYMFSRLKNSFAVATEESQVQAMKIIEDASKTQDEINYIKESAGTERANRTRIEQMNQLIDKWKERPLFGWGYGSSAGDYLRSGTNTPYAYEMVGVALLLKIGLIGILIWTSFICYLIIHILKKLSTKTCDALAIIYLIVSLGISTQFNPFLFTSSGMGILLFCFLEMKVMELSDSSVAF